MENTIGLPSLSDAGAWASIVGVAVSVCALAASVYAAWGIRRVRQKLINRARLPDLLDALSGHVAALGALLQHYEDNKNDFSTELARCEATLISIEPKLTDTIRPKINGLLNWDLRHYRGRYIFSRKAPQNSEQDAWRIYQQVMTIEQLIRNLVAEHHLSA